MTTPNLNYQEKSREYFSEDIMFVSVYPPDKGGLSEYAEALLGELSKKVDGKIIIITNSGKNQVNNNKKLEVIPVLKPNSFFSILKLALKLGFLKSKVIHFNLHMSIFGRSRLVNFFGLLVPAYAKLLGKKVVVTLHGIPETIKLEKVGLKNNFINKVGFTLALKILLKSVNVTIVLVKKYVEILRKKYGVKNVVWVPHGAWWTNQQPTWQNNNGNNTVLFMGYFGPYKEIEMVVSALKNLKNKYPNVRLIIAGMPHPNYPEEAKRIIDLASKADFVDYIGYVPQNQIPKLISKIRFVVLPYSTSTGTSGIVHFLSGLGVPFITTNTPEFLELKHQGAGIYLVKPTAKEFTKIFDKAFQDNHLMENLAEKSRSFALGRNWGKVAEIHLDIYKKYCI